MRTKILFALLVVGLSGAAQAELQDANLDGVMNQADSVVTIGFEELVSESTSYTEDGYLITTTGALRTTGQRGNPPPEVFAASSSQTNTLSAAGGTPFSLQSIQLAGGPSVGGVWPQTITFTGLLSDGGSITQSFVVTGSNENSIDISNWQTFVFDYADFQNVVSVSWQPQFTLADNITVAPPPSSTIGFEELIAESTSYTEDGYLITTTGALRTTGQRGNPPPEVYAASSSQTNTLSAADEAPFSLRSIQLAGGPSVGGIWPQTITFTGLLSGGGSVTQSFVVTGSNENSIDISNWQTFVFDYADFQNVVSVSWQPQFTLADNITVAPPISSIGFEELVAESTSYTEDGYLITTTGALRTTGQRGNPPPELYAASSSQTNTLSAAGGAPFSLRSIQLAGGPSVGGVWPQTITFTGLLSDGGSVTQSFVVTGSNENSIDISNWQNFLFDHADFQNVVSVSWQPQFTLADNITVGFLTKARPVVIFGDSFED